jgi:hypothetical protein
LRVRAHLLWRKCHAQNNTDSFGRCTLRRFPCFSSNVCRSRRSGGVNRQSRYRKRRSFDGPLLRVLSSPSPSLLVALWPSPLPLVMKGAQVRRAVKVTVYTTDRSSRPSIFIAEQFFSWRLARPSMQSPCPLRVISGHLHCNGPCPALPPKADMCGAAGDLRFGPKADIWA